jgi:histidine phosphotransferase ChpT
MPPDHRLAELVAARICHDLGSPASTLVALQGEAGAEAILRETADELRLRHRLLSAAFGMGDEADLPALRDLLRGAPMAHRVSFVVEGEAAPLPAGRARVVLVAALLAAEALPRGGTVRIAAGPLPYAAWPEGRDAAWTPALGRLLAGESTEDALAAGPRGVLAPWFAALLRAEGLRASFALGTGPAAAPLLIEAG